MGGTLQDRNVVLEMEELRGIGKRRIREMSTNGGENLGRKRTFPVPLTYSSLFSKLVISASS